MTESVKKIKLDGNDSCNLYNNHDKLEFLSNNSQSLKTGQYSNKQYLMSIVIPVYNTQNYIEKCFLSILNQSIFDRIEIIFVDDCSDDESMDKLIELKNKYENVKVLSTDKNSLFGGRPRNIGFEHVTSDYVLFFDSDDTLMENVCELLLNTIIEHDADIVFGTHVRKTFSKQDKEKYEIRTEIIPELCKYYEESEELVINDIRDYPFILKCYSVSNKLFNVNFIKENQITFPEYIPAEDSLFLFKAMINSKKTVFIPKYIFEYNLTRNKDNDRSVSFRSNHATRVGRLKSYSQMYKISRQKDIENIFIEYGLYYKITYMLRINVFNQKMPYNEYVELFDTGYPLFEALLNSGLCSKKYTKLFTKIVNKDYDGAIELCKKLK